MDSRTYVPHLLYGFADTRQNENGSARIATKPARVAATDPTHTLEQARCGLATKQADTAPAGSDRSIAEDGTAYTDPPSTHDGPAAVDGDDDD